MATVKVTFYLPIWDNDGSEIIEFAEELEDRLYNDSIMWTWNGYVCGTYRMQSGARCDDICQSFSLSRAIRQSPSFSPSLQPFLSLIQPIACEGKMSSRKLRYRSLEFEPQQHL